MLARFLYGLVIFLILFSFVNAAHSEQSSVLPVKVNIIRCITPQEKEKACIDYGACCHLIEPCMACKSEQIAVDPLESSLPCTKCKQKQ